jgi:ribosome modulation factor
MSVIDQAFNKGSQARIEGTPRSENPLGTGHSSDARAAWWAGWDHVDRNWGRASKRAVAPLVSVRKARTGAA